MVGKKNKNSPGKVYGRVKTPTVLQMEAAECGAASLAMILAYYGSFVPLEQLRIDCGVSRDGSNARNLLRAARKHGLEAKGYRKEPQDLQQMKPPLIIHWNFNHFLVFEGFSGNKAYLNDPGHGRRTVSLEEFDQSFTGVVMTFAKTPDFVKQGAKADSFKALGVRLRGSRNALIYIVIVGLALVIPGLVVPTFTKVFIDDVLIGGKTNWLNVLLLGMGITAAIKGMLKWLQNYYLLRLETKIALSSASKFLWHVLRLPVEFFLHRYAGDISNRVSSNDTVAKLLSGQLATAALNLMMIVFYFWLMLQYDVVLTLVGLAAAVINLVFLLLVSKKRVDQNMKLLQDKGKVVSTAISGLYIIETLKATGSESGFFEKWAGHQAKLIRSEQEIGVSNQYLASVPSVLTGITNALVLILGARRILDGYITVGMLVAFQSLMSSFLTPVTEMVNLGSRLQEVKGDMNRLDDVLKYPLDVPFRSEESQTDEPEQSPTLTGAVEIRNLTFGYSPLEPPLIENFNLKLKPGSRVALVGESGSGKSTIAKLISGLYRPWSGEILFDGRTRAEIPRSVVTNCLAMVDQDIVLFEGTLRDNLTMWDETIPEPDLIRAAKDAGIHEVITAREGGYSSIIGEGGRNFSGGQRQRLEIARALTGNPTILIMDEATSALDPKIEALIDQNIRRRGCTCIIVAHRLSTIRDCDEIIMLDHGKIVQRGTHEAMKNTEGPYARMIAMN
ncbi:MAG TPA: NHLP family bacteriocin export ABC transporter peptidase/permease/ATPase subunit [Bacillota bacterium]|nr:NHLP family bacteriocin export ABC transporter peptidase/permease/ATPase subunit [Bacillota bacterium]